MRTLRIVAFITILGVALPFAFFFGPAHAGNNDAEWCEAMATWHEGIGKKRDEGVSMHEIIGRVQNGITSGKIPPTMYVDLIHTIAFVYANPKMKPPQMAAEFKKECFSAHGIVGI